MLSILHSITVHSIDYLTLPIGLSLSLLWGLYAVAIVVCVVRQSPGTHRPLSPLIESIGRKVLQPKILPVFRRGKVARREFRATCCCPNIFCHKMITSGPIIIFEVSIEPYWSAQHDGIFESSTPTSRVAKIETKIFIHIWLVSRAT